MKTQDMKMNGFEELEVNENGCVLVPEINSKDVIDFRLRLQMTQEQFAAKFEIPLATLRNWEQDRTKPIISQARLVFYNKLFDEKARVIVRLGSLRSLEVA